MCFETDVGQNSKMIKLQPLHGYYACSGDVVACRMGNQAERMTHAADWHVAADYQAPYK